MIDQGPVALAEPTVAPRTGTTHADDATKTFVLDTNVILHDSACLRQFAEHDVAIPITVLEELDRFKKGSEDKHFHARQFLREVDALTGDALALPDARPPAPDDLDPAYGSPPVDASPPDGVPLGPGLGRLRVVFGGEFRKKLAAFFTEQTPDHRILEAALTLRERSPGPVILVTKDTNLRMKAKAFGLVAQDYENDKIADADVLYTGKRLVEGLDRDFISKFYSDETRQRVSVEEFADACDAAVPEAPFEPPVPHENFILKNCSNSALATFDPAEGLLRRVEKPTAYGIQPRNAEQLFAMRSLLDESVRLVTLAGKAGSGKTLLALAAALQQKQEYRQVLLARPVVPLSNRDLGYLPGDVNDKLDPYMQPLFDNLNVIRHAVGDESGDGQKIAEMRESGKIEISPLAYIRGRSLSRVFFIVDEAQNLTPHEVKTIITRAGEGTKIVLTGDIHQIDHPYLDSRSNGLSYLINRMKGQSIYAHVTLEKGERSELAELASDLL